MHEQASNQAANACLVQYYFSQWSGRDLCTSLAAGECATAAAALCCIWGVHPPCPHPLPCCVIDCY